MNPLMSLWTSPTWRLLVLSTGFALALLALRIAQTGSLMFVFLAWNLFLAGIPWLVSHWLVQRPRRPWVIAAGLGVWMLFFPNAPYILTDLFHLRPRPEMPQWYDLTLIMAFAWAGLLMGLSSLRDLQAGIFDRWGRGRSWLVTTAILLLSGFGVYLGRYHRWNSWDLLTQPGDLITDVLDPVLAPHQNLGALGFTLCFGGFLLLLYYAFRPGQQA